MCSEGDENSEEVVRVETEDLGPDPSDDERGAPALLPDEGPSASEEVDAAVPDQGTREALPAWLGPAAGVACLALVAAMAYAHLSVPLLVLLTAYLLLPARSEPWARRLLTVDLILGLAWLIGETQTVFSPFVIAAVVAYLGDPLIDRFEARRVPRGLAILILFLPLAGGLMLVGTWLVPSVVEEASRLATGLPAAGTTVQGWMHGLAQRIPLASGNLEWEEYLGQIAEYTGVAVQQVVSGVVSVGKGVSALANFLSYLVLTPILTFYLLKDWDDLVATVDGWVAPNDRPTVRRIAGRLDELLGAYFRGQVLICGIIGVLTWGGLSLVGVDLALLLGLLAGICNLVPVVGLIASVVPALVVALFDPEPLLALGKVLAVFGIVQILEQAVLSPRIVGDRVGLHPVAVMLAIVVFPIFWGFVGVLLAVPFAAGLRVLVEELAPSLRASR